MSKEPKKPRGRTNELRNRILRYDANLRFLAREREARTVNGQATKVELELIAELSQEVLVNKKAAEAELEVERVKRKSRRKEKNEESHDDTDDRELGE